MWSSRVFIFMFISYSFWGCSFDNKSQKNTDDIDLDTIHKKKYILNDSLSSSVYVSYSGYSPKDGFVSTPEIAAQIAELVLIQIYGLKNIEKQKPFSIKLENEIWLIEGQIQHDYQGGVAYMEIRKTNGEIIKVIHGK